MSNFSFLRFQYGYSKKPQSKPAPHLSSFSKSSETTPHQLMSFTSKKARQRSSSFPRASSAQPKVEELRYAFDKFDTNQDGKISKEEYKSALKTLDKDIAEGEITKSFRALDIDGDGFIVFKEFMEMFNVGADESRDNADIQGAFRLFDLDGNGKISAEELSLVLKKLGENCSLGACRNMVKGVDMDGDGFIDMKEFTKMMGTFKKTTA